MLCDSSLTRAYIVIDALDEEPVARAVNGFIDFKVSKLQSLKSNPIQRNRVRDVMRERANDTFLWVALVAEELGRKDGCLAYVTGC
ncbi:hypothetical protein jhhlp_001082 [Lomentospora prolificans]|uniref:Uncharacterized protein n=1 Tax=Lomentospora prolificans TaxID=41688 RepID=A0A2N3NH51_9PEZI|nr:hypothetical protein jhhlp_001082 [Lomentospora prolificans]